MRKSQRNTQHLKVATSNEKIPGAANPPASRATLAWLSNLPSVKLLTWNGLPKGRPRKFSRGGSLPDIYPDGEVCRLLGINRTHLIMSRKQRFRGLFWDVVGHHAGMTASWILRENPKVDLAKISAWRIKPGDGVVSVQVLQHTNNINKLVCRRLSDNATIVVSVGDASQFLDGYQFDAYELAGTYRWSEALNRI